MPAEGFEYTLRGSDVRITHHGRHATTLRGTKADEFLAEVEARHPQELTARVTGNFRRGNERERKQHPRNRSR